MHAASRAFESGVFSLSNEYLIYLAYVGWTRVGFCTVLEEISDLRHRSLLYSWEQASGPQLYAYVSEANEWLLRRAVFYIKTTKKAFPYRGHLAIIQAVLESPGPYSPCSLAHVVDSSPAQIINKNLKAML